MAFAVQRGKQIAKKVVRETVSRFVSAERADSLLNQMKGLDIGDIVSDGESIIVERPEGTFVYEHAARDENSNLSGVISVYDATEGEP